VAGVVAEDAARADRPAALVGYEHPAGPGHERAAGKLDQRRRHMRALDPDLVQPPRAGAEGDRAEGLAAGDLRPQDRVAVLLGIGAQRPTRVDHRDAEGPELLVAGGGERLVENGAGLG